MDFIKDYYSETGYTYKQEINKLGNLLDMLGLLTFEVYTAEKLEKQLTISAETFLNTDGIKIDRERTRVSLSRIFKWYGGDFGKTQADRLRFIAPYLYHEEDRNFLAENAQNIKVDYQDYDWRLNRY